MSAFDWLTALKAGDEVALDYGWNGHRIVKVDRVTKTQIICEGRRYTRDTGRELGARGGRFNINYLREATPELKEEVLRARLVRLLAGTKWDLLTTDQLRQVVKDIGLSGG